MKKDTSWNIAAEWYDDLLAGEGTYQRKVILPNLVRMMDIRHAETILDLGCGQGFFAREFFSAEGGSASGGKKGVKVIGVDASEKLIARAKELSPKEIVYHVAKSHAMSFLKSESVHKAAIVLALQNIEDLHGTLAEVNRVLRPNGSLIIVLNHPAFRVPKNSSWGWDPETKMQYRRIDRYLSESKAKIQMHPGDAPNEYTLSFHRPLQVYFKAFAKAGFAVKKLEEWISHKTSEKGPRKEAEDIARKEIPLFMALEIVKC